MKVVLSPEAVERLEGQVRYMRDAFAPAAAERLRIRVLDFIENHLAHFPKTGRKLENGDLWETWIPRTKLVLWYQMDDEQITVVTVWHASQARFGESAD